ncbi:PaaI family thioesterase [Paenibacillus sp. YPG26]|uniref:PaaI family thioesterase n=1 Tax=Paenibacillus sp. YPG26 TaxID=2878915 RepID=UPI00203DC22F|nr:PaaI family thioesterase [Paenibacillus sp. YPG26]USB33621.1 PaaI family thioesterase [Paenibacillus sp. YPG26]
MTILEHYQKVLSGELEQSPVERLMGLKIISVEEGKATYEMQASGQHANPQGTCNGGIIGLLADMAMGIAYGSTLQKEETFTTIEMKVNFFRPVWNAKIKAHATLYKRGQTIGFIQCDITDENGKRIAHASSTCMTLRGDNAQGR